MFGFLKRPADISASQVKAILEIASRLNTSGRGIDERRFREATGLDDAFGSLVKFQGAGQNIVKVDHPPFLSKGQTITWPDHISFAFSPRQAAVALVNGKVECRYAVDGVRPYQFLPVTRDRTVIGRLGKIIDYWFGVLTLEDSQRQTRAIPASVSFASPVDALRAYLERYPDDDFLHETLGQVPGAVIVVDHRESDDDLVGLFGAVVGDDVLDAHFVDDGDGLDLIIRYASQVHRVTYPEDHADRDTTLRALAELLRPHYDMRLCVTSGRYDEAIFALLTREQWQSLESSHRETVARAFQPVVAASVIFG